VVFGYVERRIFQKLIIQAECWKGTFIHHPCKEKDPMDFEEKIDM
jgi:hypothetical protein